MGPPVEGRQASGGRMVEAIFALMLVTLSVLHVAVWVIKSAVRGY